MKADGLSVVIPLKRLISLAEAAEKVPDLEKQLRQTQESLTALRGIYSELLERVTQLSREVDSL